MLKRIYNSFRPAPTEPRRSDSLKEQMDATDRALDELKHRRELPTIPEVHVHVAQPSKPPEKAVAAVKIAAAIGLPALLLEIVRRLLQ